MFPVSMVGRAFRGTASQLDHVDGSIDTTTFPTDRPPSLRKTKGLFRLWEER